MKMKKRKNENENNMKIEAKNEKDMKTCQKGQEIRMKRVIINYSK